MKAILPYLYAFLVGGTLCLVGQVLIDRTKLTPARILSGYVVAGVLLGALGLYQPLIDFAGAGAAVPLTGFGSLLARGVREAVAEQGSSRHCGCNPFFGVGGARVPLEGPVLKERCARLLREGARGKNGRRSRPPKAVAAGSARGFRLRRNAPPPCPASAEILSILCAFHKKKIRDLTSRQKTCIMQPELDPKGDVR